MAKSDGLDLPGEAARAFWAAEVEHWRQKTNVRAKRMAVTAVEAAPLVEQVERVGWQRQGNFTACVVLLRMTPGVLDSLPGPVVGMAKRVATMRRRSMLTAEGVVKSWREPVDPWDANAARGASTYRAVEAAARVLGVWPATWGVAAAGCAPADAEERAVVGGLAGLRAGRKRE